MTTAINKIPDHVRDWLQNPKDPGARYLALYRLSSTSNDELLIDSPADEWNASWSPDGR